MHQVETTGNESAIVLKLLVFLLYKNILEFKI